MQAAYDQFTQNISRVNQLGQVYRILHTQKIPILEYDDILRAELVLAVSALDYFIHEIVRIGMIDSYVGKRQKTNAFLVFQCSLKCIIAYSQNPQSLDWLDNEIRSRHSWKTFENPDNIAQAISLISDKKLWDNVGRIYGRPSADIKEELRLIVDRRNKIAHEADIDPTNLPSRWPINEQMVYESIVFIENVASLIFRIVK